MDAGKLKEIEAQANFPAGVAARIESVDLHRLLEERAALLLAAAKLAKALAEQPGGIDNLPPVVRAVRSFVLDVIVGASL